MELKKLSSLLKDVNSKHKSELFIALGDPNAKPQDIERVSSGRLSIDIPLGGGIPKGRIIEIYGPESSGKTTIALHVAAAFQKDSPDKAVALMDYEHAFDKVYAKGLGVNTDELVLAQPTDMEQGLQGVDELIDTEQFSLIIIDSVAAMVPRKELEGEMGDSIIGVHAKGMSQAMRKLVGKAHRTNTTLIFINQLREKIGVMFGSPETTSGGNALKFYASIRVDVRRGTKQKDKGGDIISNRGRLNVVKNKTYPPYKNSEFDIEFGTGVSQHSDVLDYGVAAEIFEKKGSWFYYHDSEKTKITLGNGKPAAVEYLKANPEFTNEVHKILLDSLI